MAIEAGTGVSKTISCPRPAGGDRLQVISKSTVTAPPGGTGTTRAVSPFTGQLAVLSVTTTLWLPLATPKATLPAKRPESRRSPSRTTV